MYLWYESLLVMNQQRETQFNTSIPMSPFPLKYISIKHIGAIVFQLFGLLV